MIPPCLLCDPVASRCCIVSARKPAGTQAIAEEVTTSPKESDNRRLWVEQSIGVLGRSTPDSKSREPQVLKRLAVGSPEARDVNAGDPNYALITLTQSETDDEMQDLWDYAQWSPRSPITVSNDDYDKEQDPSLGPCTARLERISLGADGDARASIEAKKKEEPAKRIAKRPRRARKDRVPSRTYRWVENCFLMKEVLDPLARFNKHLKPIGIWATCKLCLYKNLNVKALGVKTKKTHCPSWTGCVKHVENRHCLHTPEEIDEAIADCKAHWDNLEDKKARERGVETRRQG